MLFRSLPLKIRAKGAALATASDFLGNFLVSDSVFINRPSRRTDEITSKVVEITPPALQNIGWRTYVIFAALNLVNASLVWAFYPETAGLTLESIDKLFREYDIEKDKKRELEGSGDDLKHVDACEGTSQAESAQVREAVSVALVRRDR